MDEFAMIAKYINIEDCSNQDRFFHAEIYQHKTLQLVCEIRSYKDGMSCISHGFINGKGVYDHQQVSVLQMEKSLLNIRLLLLNDAVLNITRLQRSDES